ncbi:MAG TPA: hypothetical protein VGJ00_00815 [Rhabdochlamydiaceae bacterium]|jgi:hypothetical protein
MSCGFIKLFRGTGVELLQNDPKAYLLLSQIALRALRRDANYSDLKANQAYIGDHENIGLSQQEYRNAKKRLSKYDLVSFISTNKGTIATLISSQVFDINAETDIKEQPNFSMENLIKKQSKNTLKTVKEHLTRKEECKNEKNPPLPAQSCDSPEDLEKWKKMLISSGWTENEVNEAWEKYLAQPSGSIKNVRKWLKTVLQSIRDEAVKKAQLQEVTEKKAREVTDEKKRADLQAKEKKTQENQRILKNKEFMTAVEKSGIGQDRYIIGEKCVKLIGGKWEPYGFNTGFLDTDFMKLISEHLNLEGEMTI